MHPIRRLICKHLCDKVENLDPFTTLQHRSRQYLILILRKQFPNAQIKLRDRVFSAPSLYEFEVWLHNDLGDEEKYNPEWYDCDDFAIALRHEIFKLGKHYKTTLTIAYCEGYDGPEYHGYNLLIDNNDAMYIIEPQDDNIVPANDSAYRTDFIQF